MRRRNSYWIILLPIIIWVLAVGMRMLFRWIAGRPEEPWHDSLIFGSAVALIPMIIFTWWEYYNYNRRNK